MGCQECQSFDMWPRSMLIASIWEGNYGDLPVCQNMCKEFRAIKTLKKIGDSRCKKELIEDPVSCFFSLLSRAKSNIVTLTSGFLLALFPNECPCPFSRLFTHYLLRNIFISQFIFSRDVITPFHCSSLKASELYPNHRSYAQVSQRYVSQGIKNGTVGRILRF